MPENFFATAKILYQKILRWIVCDIVQNHLELCYLTDFMLYLYVILRIMSVNACCELDILRVVAFCYFSNMQHDILRVKVQS